MGSHLKGNSKRFIHTRDHMQGTSCILFVGSSKVEHMEASAVAFISG
jgi:hypothetical protein